MIPKKLHFIWIGDNSKLVPDRIESWSSHHPGWEIKLWDNERFLGRSWRCAAQMKDIGRRDVRGIVELMRLEILHDEGGVAVDVDSFCVGSISDAMLACQAFGCWVDEAAQPGVMSTSFVGVAPQHQVLGRLLEEILADRQPLALPVEDSVGNRRFTQAWQAANHASIAMYPSHIFLSLARVAQGQSHGTATIGLHERASTREASASGRQATLHCLGAPAQPAPRTQSRTGPGHSDRRGLRVIVFSKDRPLQLHATLASLHASCTDSQLLDVRVLMAASDDAMRQRYRQVASELPFATLTLESDFQKDLCNLVTSSSHVLFACDDALFVQPWSVVSCLGLLADTPDAIGISLRLGTNTTYCYPHRRSQRLPESKPLGAGWSACHWAQAELDFSYPLELSSSIYRVRDILPLIMAIAFRNPNQLEDRLAASAHGFAGQLPLLVYPSKSIAFCAPINVVQSTHANRHGGRAGNSAHDLALRFDQGLRVDVRALMGYVPNACHEEIDLPLGALASAGMSEQKLPA